MASDAKKVITEDGMVFGYVNLLEPRAINEGATPKYNAEITFKKTDKKTYQNLMTAIQTAYDEGQAKLKGNGKVVPPLSAVHNPVRDGDIERAGDPHYEGCYFFNASNTVKPGIVDKDLNPIMDPNEIYSGMIGRASLRAYCYNSNGNKGISLSLQNIMKTADGPRLGGHKSAAEDFAGLDDEDDFLS